MTFENLFNKYVDVFDKDDAPALLTTFFRPPVLVYHGTKNAIIVNSKEDILKVFTNFMENFKKAGIKKSEVDINSILPLSDNHVITTERWTFKDANDNILFEIPSSIHLLIKNEEGIWEIGMIISPGANLESMWE